MFRHSVWISLCILSMYGCSDDSDGGEHAAHGLGSDVGNQATGVDGTDSSTAGGTAGVSTGGTVSGGTVGTGTSTAGGGTATGGTDSGTASDGGVTGGTDTSCPTLTGQPPVQTGVVYAGHHYTNDMRIYRTDGANPVDVGNYDLGGVVASMALHSAADRLYIAQDVSQRVKVLSVSRPDSPQTPFIPPKEVIDLKSFGDDRPIRLAIDPLRSKLFVVATPPVPSGEIMTTMNLYVFDISGPSPVSILSAPMTVPAMLTMDVDPLTGVLFLVGLKTGSLHLYNVAYDSVSPLSGNALDLKQLFPETSSKQTAFNARALKVHPWTGQVLIARAQGAASELMAFSYPPGGGPGCPPQPDHSTLTAVPDYFDVTLAPEIRANLLDAFNVLPDYTSTHSFLVAGAWDGTMVRGFVVPMTQDLKVGPACLEYEGFGCFLRSHVQGQPMGYKLTQGASCLDTKNKVLVSTSISDLGETDPGYVHYFKYTEALGMTRWLPADGTTHATTGVAVDIVCH